MKESSTALPLNVLQMHRMYSALQAEYNALKERYIKLETEKAASQVPPTNTLKSTNGKVTVQKIQ